MLVPAMTTEEVYREIMRDLVFIKRRSHQEAAMLHREWSRKGLRNETRTLCYKTPYRNEWTIVFLLDATGTKTKFYIKTHDKKGMVAYGIQFMNEGTREEDYYVIKYSGHFFDRYNERMHLGLTDSSKILKLFFRSNFDHQMGVVEPLECGVRCVQYVFKEGLGAAWQHDAKKTVHMKTFISNDILTHTQRNLAEHIKYAGDEDEFFHTIKLHNVDTAF